MSSVQTSSCFIVDWKISDKLTGKESVRSRWERDFNNNHSILANKIAESITAEAFSNLSQNLSNPYTPFPTSSAPIELSFSLELDRQAQVEKIKEWAQNAAELPPFKEWFQTFSNENNSYMASKNSFKSASNRDRLETNYFQNKMSSIGRFIEKIVLSNFLQFAQNQNNAKFKYNVDWYRKAEHLLKNPIDSRDNRLFVKMWIE